MKQRQSSYSSRTKRKGVRISSILSWSLCGLAALLLVAALFSTVVSPRHFVLLAFAGLGYPFTLTLIGLLLLIMLLIRKYTQAIFCVVLLLISIPSFLTYCPLNFDKQPVPQDAFKVLSFNVHAFNFQQNEGAMKHPTLRYINDCDADIVCLQEAYITKEDKRYMTLAAIRSALPQYPYIHHTLVGKNGSSLLLLSKYPILSSEKVELPTHSNGAAKYVLNVKGRELLLYNIHLEGFGVSQLDGRDYVDLAKGGNAVELTKRVTYKLSPAFRQRAQQVDALLTDMKSSNNSNIIAVGDFNDTPISYTRSRLCTFLEDTYRETGSGPGFSYVFKRIGLRIDYILHSNTLNGYNCFVDRSVHSSDHAPILASFTFK